MLSFLTLCHMTVGGGVDRVVKADAEARQRRVVEREGRRRRRRERRQRAGPAVAHDEGMSSDDELLETDRMEFTDKFGQPIFFTLQDLSR